MGVWLGPVWANGEGKEPLFTVTKNGSPAVLGTDYLYTHSTVNGTEQWEMALLTDCVVKFARVGKVDISVIGAGNDGCKGTVAYVVGVGSKTAGGDGGRGGDILRVTNVELPRNTDLSATIGQSNGDATSFESYSSSSPSAVPGSSGGDGAYANGIQTAAPGGDGDDGSLPFSTGTSMLFPGVKFSPGGAGGGTKNGDFVSKGAGAGGVDGGGNGGTEDGVHTGANGAANRGAGAGGGFTSADPELPYDGGTGGSGNVLVRDHRG